ncbi:MAG: hypothetical protein ACJZ70_09200 [Limisphaerales bacterium]
MADGMDVNAIFNYRLNEMRRVALTPLDMAIGIKETEIADLLRKHGGKTSEELKAEGK